MNMNEEGNRKGGFMKLKVTVLPSKAAKDLLVKALDGGSGVETCQGTKTLWGQLEKAGYVKKMEYGGFLGHPFSYNITNEGRKALELHKAEQNPPGELK
jgi:hypothetical protein